MNLVISICAVVLSFCGQSSGADHIHLENVTVAHHVSSRFVGVTFDSSLIRKRWSSLNLRDTRVISLAKGLAPNYIRLGGTDCDFLIFDKGGQNIIGKREPTIRKAKETYSNFTMTVGDWDMLNQFLKEVGWDLIFDFNALLRKHGKWDPTNAIELLKYSIQKGYKPAGYELGNELNFPKFNVTAKQLAPDYGSLKKLLSSMKELAPYIILGTDTGSLKATATNFMTQFFQAGGGASLDKVTFHHYYMHGVDATVENFHSVSTLDSLRPLLINILQLCRKYVPGKGVWLGETSSASSGGSIGLSEQYVAGFLWLDKLGMSAELGIQGVMRQTFYGGNYGLISHHMDPNPDYWITLLYKRLVGTTVLHISSPNTSLRLYAHCTNYKSSMGYTAGSVTLFMINLSNKTLSLDFSGVSGKSFHNFFLSPGDHYGLTSRYIKLNGNVLRLTTAHELPQLKPVVTQGRVLVHPYYMGFIVIPDARKDICH